MKKYTFACCGNSAAADSYNGIKNYLPSISKQVNGTKEVSKEISSIS